MPDPLVLALSRPETWPDAPDAVDVVETHLSWVFLTRYFAFKLKKAVRLMGQDYRTLAARLESARTEVALNRRLAPTVYLGYLPVVRGDGGQATVGGAGEVVDWLVWMRRLSDRDLLDGALRAGLAGEDRIRQAADHLAHFTLHQPRAGVDAPAYLNRLRRTLRAGTHVLARHRGLPTGSLARIERSLHPWLTDHAAPLGRRAGRVIEGHGDLRPEHVVLGPQAAFIDCLEFDRQLRLLDPIDEIAFLGVASERLGAPRVGAIFLEVYTDRTGDAPFEGLVDFYAALRALTRARLAAQRSWEPGEDMARTTRTAVSWLRAAEAHARAIAREEVP